MPRPRRERWAQRLTVDAFGIWQLTFAKQGTRSNLVLFFHMSSNGGGEVNYSITTSHSRVDVQPAEGTLSNEEKEFVVTVDVTGLSSGAYDMGKIRVDLTDGSQPLPNSPYQIPISVVVAEEIYALYTPVSIR